MKIIKPSDVEPKDVTKDPLFFGGNVNLQSILEENHIGERIQVAMVNFAPSARNKFHTHTTEQILVVTEGTGIIATKEQEHLVTPGMIAFIAPGEEHWHGATKGSAFSHLSILGQPNEMKIIK